MGRARHSPKRQAGEPSKKTASPVRLVAILVALPALAILAWLGVRATWPNGSAPSPIVQAAAPLDSLVGEWARDDGDYVIRVRGIAPDGKADVAYLNPRPIHVAQAKASAEGQTLHLYVEMQDVGYPGSTYNLTYRPAEDSLDGMYFQAVQQQQYDVVFRRIGTK